MRKGKEPAPLIHGGGQEQGLRSGTLSPALCVGFGAAAKLADERARATMIMLRSCGGRGRGARAGLGHQRQRRASLSQAISTSAAKALMRHGLSPICATSLSRSESACASGSGRPSHVLRALGLDYREARSSIRLGFGRYTSRGAGRCLRPDRSAARRAGEARRVTLVRFLPGGRNTRQGSGSGAGQRLLDVAWAAREPLEGACEGVMACSTCHVIVDAEDFAKLPAASEEEEDLLDLAAHATRTSRLACQIMLTERDRIAQRPDSAGSHELDGPLSAYCGSAAAISCAVVGFLRALGRACRRGRPDGRQPGSVSYPAMSRSSSVEPLNCGLSGTPPAKLPG